MLCLWSGGCDSSLMLYDIVQATLQPIVKDGTKQYRMCGNFIDYDPDEKINVISINHEQVPAKEESKKARKKLIEILSKRFKQKRIFACEVDIVNGGDYPLSVCHNNGIIQPTLWLLHAAQYLDASEDLYVGYIRTDDIWHYKQDFIAAFELLQKLANRTGKLIFPLEWYTKHDVIKSLKQVKIYQHVWYCENPHNGKRCRGIHKCHPCDEHDAALARITKIEKLEKLEHTKIDGIIKRTRRNKRKGASVQTMGTS